MENNCYMSLMTDIRFLPCIIKCHQGLEYVKSKYPYIVLIPEDNPYMEEQVQKYNIKYKKIKIDVFQNTKDYYDETINKFQILTYTEYDKICFLDGDLIVIKNIDNEFLKLTNEYNVLKYYSTNNGITGEIFITRTNKELYNIIKSVHSFYTNDEEILNLQNKKDINKNSYNILYNFFMNSKNNELICDSILHFGGRIKPWEKQIEGFTEVKKFFHNTNKEDFFKILSKDPDLNQLKNNIYFLSFYNSLFLKNYVIFVNNEKELDKAIEIKKLLNKYNCLYPLVIITDKQKKIDINKVDQYRIPVYYTDFKRDISLLEKINYINRFFPEYSAVVCFINNININIEENIDYIFYKNIPEKYKKDMILITLRT